MLTAPETVVTGGVVSAPGSRTVNEKPSEAVPSCGITVTSTVPGDSDAGTVTAMDVSLHAVTVAVVVSNITVPLPCVAPKPDPAMVTEAPASAPAGVIDVMVAPAVAPWHPGVLAQPIVVCVVPARIALAP